MLDARMRQHQQVEKTLARACIWIPMPFEALSTGLKRRVMLAEAWRVIPISCCWMSRPITSTLRPSAGWKNCPAALRWTGCSLSLTIGMFLQKLATAP